MHAPSRLRQPTRPLDFTHLAIEALVEKCGLRRLPMCERICAAYGFVRNEIASGYVAGGEVPASKVLADGVGQCSTKGSLLKALLRAVGLPCHFHGFTLDKPQQEAAIKGLDYVLAPQRIIHGRVEVTFEGRSVNLEGCPSPGQPATPVSWSGMNAQVQRIRAEVVTADTVIGPKDHPQTL